MVRPLKNERGATLFELIVAIILVGVVLPSVVMLFADISLKSTKFSVTQKAVALARAKMEEIVGKKETNWDWYKQVDQFSGSENLGGGFHRTVTVQKINRWGRARIDAWQVTVNVTRELLPEGYTLVVRLTKYH